MPATEKQQVELLSQQCTEAALGIGAVLVAGEGNTHEPWNQAVLSAISPLTQARNLLVGVQQSLTDVVAVVSGDPL